MPKRKIGHNFNSASQFLGNRKQKKYNDNTTIMKENEKFVVIHYGKKLFELEPGMTTLFVPDELSVTTKIRINEFLDALTDVPYLGVGTEKFVTHLYMRGIRLIEIEPGAEIQIGMMQDPRCSDYDYYVKVTFFEDIDCPKRIVYFKNFENKVHSYEEAKSEE